MVRVHFFIDNLQAFCLWDGRIETHNIYCYLECIRRYCEILKVENQWSYVCSLCMC